MIIIGGIIEGISTRKDKTMKLTIGTQELTPEQAASIFQYNQQFGYFAIKAEQFQKEERDLIDGLKSDYEGKSPAQRMRGVLYRNWELKNEGFHDFNSYYINKMELMIKHFKDKLDEESY